MAYANCGKVASASPKSALVLKDVNLQGILILGDVYPILEENVEGILDGKAVGFESM
jgi:hypothetical protein